MKTRALAALFPLAFVAVSGSARADAVLSSASSTVHPSRTDLDLTIVDQVATTVSDLRFSCCGGETTRFSAKLPAGASVIGFDVWVGGGWQKAMIVNGAPPTPSTPGPGQGNADAIAAYLDDDGFTIDLPALPEVRVRMTTLGLATYDLGQVGYVLPVDPAPVGSGPSGEVHAVVTVRSDRAIVGYSGDLGGETLVSNGPANGEYELVMKYDAATAKKPFRFQYAVDEAPGLYARLVTDHERCDSQGFFLLLVEPPANVSETDVQPKAFSFVMDRSGSMQGPKIAQAKAAAQIGVDLLNGTDDFNVISFSTDVTSLFDAPKAVDAGTRAQAKGYIGQQIASGGTNISGGLQAALAAKVDGDRARIVVFLTDGQPTAGVTDPGAIVAGVKQQNVSGARVYTFGIGADVNKQLLKNIATATGGEARTLAANADLSGEIGSFLKSVSQPVLLDATTSFTTVSTTDTYPEGTQDLFAGRQLMLIGRYGSGGKAKGTLAGTLGGAAQSTSFDVDFPACALDAAPFLPRLWAKAKIDALLAKIAAEGHADPALEAEIVALSNQYGIQSPYAGYGVGPVGNNGSGSGSNGTGTGTGTGNGAGTGSSSSDPGHYTSGDLGDQAGCSVAERGSARGGWMGLVALVAAAGALVRRRR
jgi:Ca-activated chloride channel family protein